MTDTRTTDRQVAAWMTEDGRVINASSKATCGNSSLDAYTIPLYRAADETSCTHRDGAGRTAFATIWGTGTTICTFCGAVEPPDTSSVVP
jgi:hypothetical protein